MISKLSPPGWLALFIILFLLTGPVIAAPMQMVGRLPNGPVFDLIEKNGYLFVGQGGEVRVYNVSTSQKVTGLNSYNYISRFYQGAAIRRLAIDDNYLYIADEYQMAIADISNPQNPTILSTLAHGGMDSSRGIAVSGNYAYISVWGTGIRVVDVSNKAQPSIIRTITVGGPNMPMRSTISGNYLYVVSGNPFGGMMGTGRLDIFDISNPASPVLIGTYSASTSGGTVDGGFSGVAVKDSYAYITQYYSGARVIDVSNPGSPTYVRTINISGANDIRILGNYAYISTRYEDFRIYDISNPGVMNQVSIQAEISGYTEGIYPTPNYTFLASESMGFGAWNTANVASPSFLAHVVVMGGADSLKIQDPYLYIGGHNDGVWIVDTRSKANPYEVAFANNRGRNEGIDVQGNTLFAAGDWSGLCVFDITSPIRPTELVWNWGDDIDDVITDGNYTFTSQYGSDSMGVVNISNRQAPSLSGSASGVQGRMAKYGTRYVVVADRYGSAKGLHIVDVNNEASPVKVSTYGAGTPYADVAISGNTAFGLTASGNLHTLDLTNVNSPRLLDQFSSSGWEANELAICNNIAYGVGGPDDSVKAFDISDPANLRLISTIDLRSPDYFEAVDCDNNYVYVGNKWGLHILTSVTGVPTPQDGVPIWKDWNYISVPRILQDAVNNVNRILRRLINYLFMQ